MALGKNVHISQKKSKTNNQTAPYVNVRVGFGGNQPNNNNGAGAPAEKNTAANRFGSLLISVAFYLASSSAGICHLLIAAVPVELREFFNGTRPVFYGTAITAGGAESLVSLAAHRLLLLLLFFPNHF